MRNSLLSKNEIVLFALKAVFLVNILINVLQFEAAIINEKAFGSLRCVPYAYGDFNADKFVDVYCVSQPGNLKVGLEYIKGFFKLCSYFIYKGNRIEIWIAQESMDPIFILYRQTYLKYFLNILNFLLLQICYVFFLRNNSTIVNIVPGDFTGDSEIDMLVIYEAEEGSFKMTLFVGNKKTRYENDLEKVVEYDFILLDHPFAAE